MLFDAAGRRRALVTLPGCLSGRSPHNKGMRYPADPARVEEIIAVMRQAGEDRRIGISEFERGVSAVLEAPNEVAFAVIFRALPSPVAMTPAERPAGLCR
jgi:hypothetical protein